MGSRAWRSVMFFQAKKKNNGKEKCTSRYISSNIEPSSTSPKNTYLFIHTRLTLSLTPKKTLPDQSPLRTRRLPTLKNSGAVCFHSFYTRVYRHKSLLLMKQFNAPSFHFSLRSSLRAWQVQTPNEIHHQTQLLLSPSLSNLHPIHVICISVGSAMVYGYTFVS